MKITFKEGILNLSFFNSNPLAAKKLIPEWYKKIPPANKNNESALKSCVPFLDAFMTGYIQTTHSDIYVKQVNKKAVVHTDSVIPFIDQRLHASIHLSNDYENTEYVWERTWITKLPKGFSMLITHPLNQLDLPFTTLSAIVDADTYHHRGIGNIPFYLKKGFEGVIPKGTPMYQIIPFQRNNWTSVIKKFDFQESLEKNKLMNQLGDNAYKHNFHVKKDYS